MNYDKKSRIKKEETVLTVDVNGKDFTISGSTHEGEKELVEYLEGIIGGNKGKVRAYCEEKWDFIGMYYMEIDNNLKSDYDYWVYHIAHIYEDFIWNSCVFGQDFDDEYFDIHAKRVSGGIKAGTKKMKKSSIEEYFQDCCNRIKDFIEGWGYGEDSVNKITFTESSPNKIECVILLHQFDCCKNNQNIPFEFQIHVYGNPSFLRIKEAYYIGGTICYRIPDSVKFFDDVFRAVSEDEVYMHGEYDIPEGYGMYEGSEAEMGNFLISLGSILDTHIRRYENLKELARVSLADMYGDYYVASAKKMKKSISDDMRYSDGMLNVSQVARNLRQFMDDNVQHYDAYENRYGEIEEPAEDYFDASEEEYQDFLVELNDAVTDICNQKSQELDAEAEDRSYYASAKKSMSSMSFEANVNSLRKRNYAKTGNLNSVMKKRD